MAFLVNSATIEGEAHLESLQHQLDYTCNNLNKLDHTYPGIVFLQKAWGT